MKYKKSLEWRIWNLYFRTLSLYDYKDEFTIEQ